MQEVVVLSIDQMDNIKSINGLKWMNICIMYQYEPN